MLGTYVEPKITRYSLEDMEYAIRVGLTSVLGKRPTDECIAVGMAKCRLETGNGEFVWNDNIGNQKQPEQAVGNYTCILLNEVEKKPGDAAPRVYWYDPRGELVGGRGSALKHAPLDVPDGHFQTRMHACAGHTDAGYEWADFLFRSVRYAEARQAMIAGSIEGFVRGLKKGGYFTAPLEAYLATATKLYLPSLAVVRRQSVEQPDVPERAEWHNQLLLDQFVTTEYERLTEGGPSAGRALLDYENADETKE